MDTSQTYIRMCEKAEEIQNHKPEYHDWLVCFTHHQVMDEDSGTFFDALRSGCPDDYSKGKVIWLPRQDQLQEIVKAKNIQQSLLFFYGWLGSYNTKYLDKVDGSMEQLWLAFVMKEKYHKVWDGENWKQT